MAANKVADQLQHDLESEEFQHGVEQRFWALLERKDHLVYMNFQTRNGTTYVMQLDCTDYGNQAIGGKFIDPQTRACVSNAWPKGDGTFGGWVKWDASNLFICWPGDRFGIAHHQEWASQRLWDRPPNPIVSYATFIRGLLWTRARGYVGIAS
jgi:hypothetical protein